MITNRPNLVWSTTLDDRYICEVERTGERTGQLVISDRGVELLREHVGLSYGAIFGPDVADVAYWEERAIKFVDEELPK